MTDSPAAPKPKFQHEDALRVATVVCMELEPACSRIQIAGSLRRNRPFVSDVEILYVSKTENRPDPADMFASKDFILVDEVIDRLIRSKFLQKRLNARGSEIFGPKNKLMVHTRTGIPVDLFSTTEENWFNYLVCRTGPAESNIRIAEVAQKKGWRWNPYGPGFSRVDQVHVVTSEKEVFDFVGLPYYEPEHRR